MGRDVHKLISTGVVTGTSFAMSGIVDSWAVEGGKDVRYIESAMLHELSPVTWPAYESAYVAARGKSNLSNLEDLRSYFNRDGRKTKMTNQKIQQTRDYWENKTFKNNEEFLQAVIRHYTDPSIDQNTIDLRIERALASGLASDDIPTPEGFMYDLIKRAPNSELYLRATKYPLSGYNTLILPAVDEKQRSDSQYGSCITYLEDEADAYTASVPQFRQVKLRTKKIISLAYLTEKLIQENVKNYTMNVMSTSKMRKLNSLIVRGTGAGEFLGIIESGACIVADAEGAQAAGSFVAENAGIMLSHLATNSYHNLTCWLIQPALYATLALQQYNSGNVSAPLIQWRSGGEKFNKMLGFDMIPCDACSEAGSVGDIILADLSQYIIAEKQVNKQTSGHVRFIYDEMALKLTWRADGAPAWSQPCTAENSSTLVSPFVTLAAR